MPDDLGVILLGVAFVAAVAAIARWLHIERTLRDAALIVRRIETVERALVATDPDLHRAARAFQQARIKVAMGQRADSLGAARALVRSYRLARLDSPSHDPRSAF